MVVALGSLMVTLMVITEMAALVVGMVTLGSVVEALGSLMVALMVITEMAALVVGMVTLGSVVEALGSLMVALMVITEMEVLVVWDGYSGVSGGGPGVIDDGPDGHHRDGSTCGWDGYSGVSVGGPGGSLMVALMVITEMAALVVWDGYSGVSGGGPGVIDGDPDGHHRDGSTCGLEWLLWAQCWWPWGSLMVALMAITEMAALVVWDGYSGFNGGGPGGH
ncbi:hypothetical protein NDU88_007501 [Pleurodeles waltl]|uniref:NADH dehydrogenase subunit 6 n=1 Tax=Pleurodeles waltl TaxID=8319 RepID=A0AAV7LSA3_PLEWA|nr:hypothetical protein NDU88_007501 [Pleurodeles waltl]